MRAWGPLPPPFSPVCCGLPQPRTAQARFDALRSAAAAAGPVAGSPLPLAAQGPPADPALYPWTQSPTPIL